MGGKEDIPYLPYHSLALHYLCVAGTCFPVIADHRLSMELDLQSLFGLQCTAMNTHWLRPRKSPPPSACGLIYGGAIGQPRWTTSLCTPCS